MTLEDEVKKLYELLDAVELPPVIGTSGFPDFSEEVKNELVAEVARTFSPAPSGQLLSRLPLIATEANRDDMVAAFLTNLRSPDPSGRRASLYGLSKLEYPGFLDLAILSLRDESDQVLAAACDLLIPRAQQDARLKKILHDMYILYKDNPDYYLTVSLLEAHQFGN